MPNQLSPAQALRLAALAVVLVAILGHVPATDGTFFRTDWTLLAQGAGTERGFAPRLLFQAGYVPILKTIVHLHATAYKTLALLLWSLCALLVFRLAFRLGQRLAGAVAAGLWVAATPLVVRPIYWMSASSLVLACVLVLLALDRWLAGGGRNGVLALVLMIAAGLTNEIALGLPVALAVALALGSGTLARERRRPQPWILAAVTIVAGLAIAVGLARGGPAGVGHPPLSAPGDLALRFAAGFGWLVTPRRFGSWEDPLLACLGTLVWVVWLEIAVRRWERGDTSAALGFAWSTIVVATAALPARELRPDQMLLAVPGLGWTVGSAIGPILEAALRRRARPAFAALVLGASAVACFAVAFGATVDQLYGRDANDRLRNGDVVASKLVEWARASVDTLAWTPDPCLCVLTPREPKLPPDAPPARLHEILEKSSPVYRALDGQAGLRLLLPDSVETHWEIDLAGIDGACQVVLDRGQSRLIPVGTADETRLSLALEAVTLDRDEEAMQLFLAVIGEGGHKIQYRYEPAGIAISLSRLQLLAPSFVRFLEQDGSAPALAVKDLFLQMFAFLSGLVEPAENPEATDEIVPPPPDEGP